MPSSSDSTALFIDRANLYATANTPGLDIDYKRLSGRHIPLCLIEGGKHDCCEDCHGQNMPNETVD